MPPEKAVRHSCLLIQGAWRRFSEIKSISLLELNASDLVSENVALRKDNSVLQLRLAAAEKHIEAVSEMTALMLEAVGEDGSLSFLSKETAQAVEREAAVEAAQEEGASVMAAAVAEVRAEMHAAAANRADEIRAEAELELKAVVERTRAEGEAAVLSAVAVAIEGTRKEAQAEQEAAVAAATAARIEYEQSVALSAKSSSAGELAEIKNELSRAREEAASLKRRTLLKFKVLRAEERATGMLLEGELRDLEETIKQQRGMEHDGSAPRGVTDEKAAQEAAVLQAEESLQAMRDALRVAEMEAAAAKQAAQLETALAAAAAKEHSAAKKVIEEQLTTERAAAAESAQKLQQLHEAARAEAVSCREESRVVKQRALDKIRSLRAEQQAEIVGLRANQTKPSDS